MFLFGYLNSILEETTLHELACFENKPSIYPLYPNFKISEKFPYLYGSAKMHKTPKNFRYITSGKESLFSVLSVAVSKCLKLLVKLASSSFGYQIKGIDNCIFIIDNRDRVIKFLNESNCDKIKSKCISSWDFSTLYTNIPHDKLKDKMAIFINRIFTEIAKSKKGKKFICVSEWGNTAYFTKSKSKNNFCWSSEELVEIIKVIIDNSYICFHEEVYRQVIGIPMGTSCAPYLANIFLHVYEYDYLQNLVRNGDMDVAKKLAKTFRYQDDCVSINDDSTFKEHYLLMYPPEMHLKNTNVSKAVCTFLDLRISLFRGKFLYRSYDKRDNFNFEICNYPNLRGNIPWKGSYGVYVSQLIRFCDINLNVNDFVNNVKTMTWKFLQQGFLRQSLIFTYLKFCNTYGHRWSKFGADLVGLLNCIF